ncbi:TIGR02611 family protein [uncultured Jatrophihabitans sp.]|uniref:TIGR02611 family protein n=1 Tax=uncultured Jatrophihabitans sp. TaxID=1610747 RepID=UPI0035CAC499
MTRSDTTSPPESESSPKRLVRRAEAFREGVRARPGGTLGWRIAVTAVGVVVVLGGIVLVPLPGPGWLIIFAGLGVLATEYEWARRLLRFARDQVQRWTDWVKRQPRWIQGLVGLLGVVFLAAVFVAVYVVLYA